LWQTAATILGVTSIVLPALVGLFFQQVRRNDLENIRSLNGLLATRDTQLRETKRDLDLVQAEHKQLLQVNIKEMVGAWERHVAATYYLDNARMKDEVLKLESRLSHHEKV